MAEYNQDFYSSEQYNPNPHSATYNQQSSEYYHQQQGGYEQQGWDQQALPSQGYDMPNTAGAYPQQPLYSQG